MTTFDEDEEQSSGGVTRWRGGDDSDFSEMVARATEAGVPIEDMAGAQTKNLREHFGVPLLFSYTDGQQVVMYRREDGIVELFNNKAPAGAAWVETDAKMTLKKAFERYGASLLAFQRINRTTTLNVTGMNIRKRVEITVRLLVRKLAAGT